MRDIIPRPASKARIRAADRGRGYHRRARGRSSLASRFKTCSPTRTPRLMMPTIAKGKGKKAVQRRPVPMPSGLATKLRALSAGARRQRRCSSSRAASRGRNRITPGCSRARPRPPGKTRSASRCTRCAIAASCGKSSPGCRFALSRSITIRRSRCWSGPIAGISATMPMPGARRVVGHRCPGCGSSSDRGGKLKSPAADSDCNVTRPAPHRPSADFPLRPASGSAMQRW